MHQLNACQNKPCKNVPSWSEFPLTVPNCVAATFYPIPDAPSLSRAVCKEQMSSSVLGLGWQLPPPGNIYISHYERCCGLLLVNVATWSAASSVITCCRFRLPTVYSGLSTTSRATRTFRQSCWMKYRALFQLEKAQMQNI